MIAPRRRAPKWSEADLAELLRHQDRLAALAYRLIGDAAEAEDVVQETFARAWVRPAVADGRPLGPWLTRVAVRLSLDALRARRARPYVGTWLPSLVETGEACAAESPEARYDLVESATIAFLVALDALTPRQRAVLVLRDVLDLGAAETAAVLATTPGAVDVALHRARAALAGYDANGIRPTAAEQARTREVLTRFAFCAATCDVPGLQALLAPDVTAFSDGGGRYAAGRHPVRGAPAVALLYARLAARPIPAEPAVHMVNGLPTLCLRAESPPGRNSPRSALQVVLDREGRIARLFAVLVPEKLRGVSFLR